MRPYTPPNICTNHTSHIHNTSAWAVNGRRLHAAITPWWAKKVKT